MSNVSGERGSQRLPISKLKAWEALGYGMFIHFGMSTFDGDEFSKGNRPSSLYAPDRLDVKQWVGIARDAGMKYAVLTAKHVSGHCLWPTKLTDYHVGTSRNKTDVVEAYVRACEDRGLMAGLYYCSWDNHHIFGSLTPTYAQPGMAYTSLEYQEFQWGQIEELLSNYGKLGEVWIDIPMVLPRDYRNRLYARIAELQPDALIVMNHGVSDGSQLNVGKVWPTDVITIERFLPKSTSGHVPWREVEGKNYYLPGEVCDTIAQEWFFVENDRLRSDAELLGMYLSTRSRRANFLLDVPPDKHGLIPLESQDALMRLQKNFSKFNLDS